MALDSACSRSLSALLLLLMAAMAWDSAGKSGAWRMRCSRWWRGAAAFLAVEALMPGQPVLQAGQRAAAGAGVGRRIAQRVQPLFQFRFAVAVACAGADQPAQQLFGLRQFLAQPLRAQRLAGVFSQQRDALVDVGQHGFGIEPAQAFAAGVQMNQRFENVAGQAYPLGQWQRGQRLQTQGLQRILPVDGIVFAVQAGLALPGLQQGWRKAGRGGVSGSSDADSTSASAAPSRLASSTDRPSGQRSVATIWYSGSAAGLIAVSVRLAYLY